jgi:hypothetical protein
MIESPHFPDDEQLARLVRATIHTATQPDNGRLKQLMPPPPTRQRALAGQRIGWAKQLAPVCVTLILCLGLFGLYHTSQPGVAGSAPTYAAITATFTSEPTATEMKAQEMTSTAVAQQTALAQTPAATPAPPTPIAALPSPVIRNP